MEWKLLKQGHGKAELRHRVDVWCSARYLLEAEVGSFKEDVNGTYISLRMKHDTTQKPPRRFWRPV